MAAATASVERGRGSAVIAADCGVAEEALYVLAVRTMVAAAEAGWTAGDRVALNLLNEHSDAITRAANRACDADEAGTPIADLCDLLHKSSTGRYMLRRAFGDYALALYLEQSPELAGLNPQHRDALLVHANAMRADAATVQGLAARADDIEAKLSGGLSRRGAEAVCRALREAVGMRVRYSLAAPGASEMIREAAAPIAAPVAAAPTDASLVPHALVTGRARVAAPRATRRVLEPSPSPLVPEPPGDGQMVMPPPSSSVFSVRRSAAATPVRTPAEHSLARSFRRGRSDGALSGPGSRQPSRPQPPADEESQPAAASQGSDEEEEPSFLTPKGKPVGPFNPPRRRTLSVPRSPRLGEEPSAADADSTPSFEQPPSQLPARAVAPAALVGPAPAVTKLVPCDACGNSHAEGMAFLGCPTQEEPPREWLDFFARVKAEVTSLAAA
jgi:hypothetical protein